MTPEEAAFQQWLLENSILTENDKVFGDISLEEQSIRDQRPWKKDPHYFKHVKISAVALLKLVTHAHSGKNLEVMGIMTGRVSANTFIVLDAFPLPVEGTETRVNAQAEADVYNTEFRRLSEELGRTEYSVGWYHSHPSYGCWLSGIDVMTQKSNQMLDPFVAVVIDPVRTAAAGRVEIGSFRTFPDDYTAPSTRAECEVIPTDKMQDFGAHANSYYQVKTTFFKTSRDDFILRSLWRRFWAQTLSSRSLVSSANFLVDCASDVVAKLKQKMKINPLPFLRLTVCLVIYLGD
ncbi:hypothetical protein GEMRC1_013398 [Eukaryota sp. GEM-RC1]